MKPIDYINRAVAYFGSVGECPNFTVKLSNSKTVFAIEWVDRNRRFWVDNDGQNGMYRVFNSADDNAYINYILIKVLDIDLSRCIYVGRK